MRQPEQVLAGTIINKLLRLREQLGIVRLRRVADPGEAKTSPATRLSSESAWYLPTLAQPALCPTNATRLYPTCSAKLIHAAMSRASSLVTPQYPPPRTRFP